MFFNHFMNIERRSTIINSFKSTKVLPFENHFILLYLGDWEYIKLFQKKTIKKKTNTICYTFFS